MYNHVWPKTSKDILPANTPLNSGCQGAMLGAMHSRGSLGRGSICDSGISASEAALAGGVGELSEPLAANRLQFMSTYFYMWSLMQ